MASKRKRPAKTIPKKSKAAKRKAKAARPAKPKRMPSLGLLPVVDWYY